MVPPVHALQQGVSPPGAGGGSPLTCCCCARQHDVVPGRHSCRWQVGPWLQSMLCCQRRREGPHVLVCQLHCLPCGIAAETTCAARRNQGTCSSCQSLFRPGARSHWQLNRLGTPSPGVPQRALQAGSRRKLEGCSWWRAVHKNARHCMVPCGSNEREGP